MNRRHAILGFVLLTTLAAAWLAPTPADEIVAPQERPTGRASITAPLRKSVTPAHVGNSVNALSLRQRDENTDLPDPFAVVHWDTPDAKPAEKPLPVVALPEPPQVPPLPFRFLGRYVDEGKAAVFLQYEDENLVVHEGDVLAEHYKVERLDGTALTLVYLPLNERQTLNLGAPN